MFLKVDTKLTPENNGVYEFRFQTEFASSFGISVGTLRHWERGDREPHGPARVLLHVVSKQPKIVLSALAA